MFEAGDAFRCEVQKNILGCTYICN